LLAFDHSGLSPSASAASSGLAETHDHQYSLENGQTQRARKR